MRTNIKKNRNAKLANPKTTKSAKKPAPLDRILEKMAWLPLVAIRLYLAPVMIVAGVNKLQNFNDTATWFGNAEWGLGLPFAPVWVALVIIAELVGGVALVLGLMTRLFASMLSVVMIVAALSVHLPNGWFAIAPTDPATSSARVLAWLPMAQQSLADAAQVGERVERARQILQTHGNYEYLTQFGNFVVLQNGMEFAITYLIMLLVLVVYGAGALSIDALVMRAWRK